MKLGTEIMMVMGAEWWNLKKQWGKQMKGIQVRHTGSLTVRDASSYANNWQGQMNLMLTGCETNG